MKRISLEELLKKSKSDSYADQYRYVRNCIEKEEVRPVKNSGLNGKKPALFQSYWILEESKDYTGLSHEIKFQLASMISTDYYMKNLPVYEKERKWVLLLSNYLNSEAGREEMSLNERSFQIWHREKFLQREQGIKILKHCGISLEHLNIYHTTEPLAYFSVDRQVPQTILMIENKDTFFSMRRYLLEKEEAWQPKPIFEESVKTLVYGAGKGILRSMEDFRFCVEPYMNDRKNRYLYFGDLDYEGIGIYERTAELFEEEHAIEPFVAAYEKMLQKAESFGEGWIDFLPDTKEGQNRNLEGRFFSGFSAETVNKMKLILEKGKYIPQEIIHSFDFTE